MTASRRLLAALVVALACSATTVHADAERGDRGQDVVEVQYQLRSLGYSLSVDGVYGIQTERTVRSWQRSNGLIVDGIAGPATVASLARAVRSSPPSDSSGGFTPPAGLTGCDLMEFYREAAGLPEQMDAIGYRESRCRNDVTSSTGCCVGFWQIHTGNFTAPGYKAGIAACGVTRRSDILGNSPEQMEAQACVAFVLYSVSGMTPWRL